jgi:hypothetical protein
MMIDGICQLGLTAMKKSIVYTVLCNYLSALGTAVVDLVLAVLRSCMHILNNLGIIYNISIIN